MSNVFASVNDTAPMVPTLDRTPMSFEAVSVNNAFEEPVRASVGAVMIPDWLTVPFTTPSVRPPLTVIALTS